MLNNEVSIPHTFVNVYSCNRWFEVSCSPERTKPKWMICVRSRIAIDLKLTINHFSAFSNACNAIIGTNYTLPCIVARLDGITCDCVCDMYKTCEFKMTSSIRICFFTFCDGKCHQPQWMRNAIKLFNGWSRDPTNWRNRWNMEKW